MRCKDGHIELAYKEATKDICECIVCGGALLDTSRDILDGGKYGIVSETRPQQVDMAREIDKTLGDKHAQRILIVEGGTGIGKSYAYLIPAILQHKNKRIVISTDTKALQEQVYADLERICAAMGVNVNIALVKGKTNYGCFKLNTKLPKGEERAKYEALCKNAIEHGKYIDFSAGAPYEKPPEWAPAVSAENCPAGSQKNCALECRPNPRMQQIIVVNHSLLGVDMFIGNIVLGQYDVLIVDEAHRLAEKLRNTLTHDVTVSRLEGIGKAITNSSNLPAFILQYDKSAVSADEYVSLLDTVAKRTETALELISGHADYGTNILHTDLPITQEGMNLLAEAKDILIEVDERLSTVIQHCQNLKLNDEMYAGRGDLYAVARKVSRALSLYTSLTDPNTIITIDKYAPLKNRKLQCMPLDIACHSGKKLDAIRHTVYTAATLKLGDRGFSFFKDTLGIAPRKPEDLVEKVLGSPFDYDANARLYVPHSMMKPVNPPRDSDRTPEANKIRAEYQIWLDQLMHQCTNLIDITHGDAMILCTSNVIKNYLYNKLKAHYANSTIHMVNHETGAATAAQNEYMAHDHSVLVGVRSFWEGISIDGDKLRMVIIPKLQFPHFNDPVIKTKQRLSNNGMFDENLQVPPMVISLKQAVGRLIRTKDDYGIVAILDPRAMCGSRNADIAAAKKAWSTGVVGFGDRKRNVKLEDAVLGYGRTVYHSLPIKRVQLKEDFTVLRKFVNGHVARKLNASLKK